MAELSVEEARLVAVHRAIDELSRPELIDKSDASAAHTALEAVLDIGKLEGELTKNELKKLVLGFVAGLGASQLGQASYVEYENQPEQSATEFEGGPTGGTAVGQGEDPKLVAQTGPRDTSSS